MSVVTTTSPIRTPALRHRDTVHADRDHEPKRSWVWTLVEALAYAGASVDPTAALAARRFARIRTRSCVMAAGEGTGCARGRSNGP